MLGFSLQKIIFTALAIAAVWYGFKLLGRLQENRDKSGGVKKAGRSSSSRDAAADDDVEELVKCAVCGDYVSRTASVNCGRDGCPYPG